MKEETRICGIIGCISNKAVIKTAKMLKGQESRGQDSTGIAWIHPRDKDIKIIKAVKTPTEFKDTYENNLSHTSNIAIGHNRLASIGEVNKSNAHPFRACNDKWALIHNGSERHLDKTRFLLQRLGHKIEGSTDSELMLHMLEEYYEVVEDLEEAMSALKEFIGKGNAVLVLDKEEERILGFGGKKTRLRLTKEGCYVMSDTTAYGELLEEGDRTEKKEFQVPKGVFSLFVREGKYVIKGDFKSKKLNCSKSRTNRKRRMWNTRTGSTNKAKYRAMSSYNLDSRAGIIHEIKQDAKSPYRTKCNTYATGKKVEEDEIEDIDAERLCSKCFSASEENEEDSNTEEPTFVLFKPTWSNEKKIHIMSANTERTLCNISPNTYQIITRDKAEECNLDYCMTCLKNADLEDELGSGEEDDSYRSEGKGISIIHILKDYSLDESKCGKEVSGIYYDTLGKVPRDRLCPECFGLDKEEEGLPKELESWCSVCKKDTIWKRDNGMNLEGYNCKECSTWMSKGLIKRRLENNKELTKEESKEITKNLMCDNCGSSDLEAVRMGNEIIEYRCNDCNEYQSVLEVEA